MKLGIDAGNYRVKVAGDSGLMDFISAIGESREINLKQQHGDDDMYFQYEGAEGFAGSLALYESEFSGSIMGDTKAHTDAKIRVLLAIHRYCSLNDIADTNFQIVVGQPIKKHNEQEKERIRQLIKGTHTITVNGVQKSFSIDEVGVAAEGASSIFSSNQLEGLIRLIDVGSATVNYATILNSRFIDKDSGTLSFGMNTNKSNNLQSLTRGIATEILKKWDSNDKTFIVGGASETLLPYLQEYFSNIQILNPFYKQQLAHSGYANAIAFYNMAVSIYG